MASQTFEYSIELEQPGHICVVKIIGELTLDSAEGSLMEIWENPGYSACAGVIYDLSEINSLPDFNDLQLLSRFVVANKPAHGPRTVAFTAEEFSGYSIRNVFASFARLVGLKLNFVAYRETALSWLEKEITG